MNHILESSTLQLLLPLLVACSGAVESTAENTHTENDTPPESAATAPLGSWELGHAMSGGETGTHPATFTVEGPGGAPLEGITFCSIPVGDCGTSDDHGSVLLNVPAGRTLINGYDDTFVQPTITFAAPEETNQARIAPRLHTPADLDAIYRSVGIDRSERRGTVVVELVGDPDQDVSGVLYDSRDGENAAVVLPGAAPDTSTYIYFLDVPTGAARVELHRDGSLCSRIEGPAWPSELPSSLATLVFSNTVTYGGVVQCL
jgi:hypothetical protein